MSAGLFVSNRSYVYLALEGEGGSAKVYASAAGALPESVACGASLFSASAKELKDIFRFVSDAAKPARGGLNFAVPMNASLLRVASMPGLADECVAAARRVDARAYPRRGAKGVPV